ncbi:MAG: hypothetical protein AAF890_06605 [Pseudomonadota bacterium]
MGRSAVRTIDTQTLKPAPYGLIVGRPSLVVVAARLTSETIGETQMRHWSRGKQLTRLKGLKGLAFSAPMMALCATLSASAVWAQDGAMSWQFYQNDPASAGLDFGVPETDNIGARAACGGTLEAGTATLTVAVDFGDKTNGESITVRFSGGGSEQTYKAAVLRPESEEGLFGASVPLYLNDPLFGKMARLASIGAAVPGFTASRFDLQTGQDAIKQFLQTCKTLANPTSATDTGDGATDNTPASDTSANASEIQSAFKFAQELDSVVAYEAFLKNYPTGFYADLARAYLEKARRNGDSNGATDTQTNQQNQGDLTATGPDAASESEPQNEQLPPLNLPIANTRWVNFSHEQDEGNARSYAAGVTGNGVQFIAWCGADKRINFELTQNGPDAYPQFDARAAQGLNGQSQPIVFSNGRSFSKAFSVMGLTGDVVMEPSEAASSAFVSSLIRENSMTIGVGTFTAPFGLRGSKQALCNVINACDATNALCARPVAVIPPPRNDNTRPSRPSTVCRPRSVLINGECILRRYADEYRRKLRREQRGSGIRPNRDGCRGNRIRVEGQCIRRSEVAAFCGPGFRLRGNRCVSRAQRPSNGGCGRGQRRLEGQCIPRALAAEFCGPGFRPRGTRCVRR